MSTATPMMSKVEANRTGIMARNYLHTDCERLKPPDDERFPSLREQEHTSKSISEYLTFCLSILTGVTQKMRNSRTKSDARIIPGNSEKRAIQCIY